MKRKVSALVAIPLVFALVPFAAAQSQPSEFTYVLTADVKRAAVAEFEDYVKKVNEGADTIGVPGPVLIYQMRIGGPGARYFFVRPFNKWGEIDAWTSIQQILVRAYGEPEAARIRKAGRATIESTRTTYIGCYRT